MRCELITEEEIFEHNPMERSQKHTFAHMKKAIPRVSAQHRKGIHEHEGGEQGHGEQRAWA